MMVEVRINSWLDYAFIVKTRIRCMFGKYGKGKCYAFNAEGSN